MITLTKYYTYYETIWNIDSDQNYSIFSGKHKNLENNETNPIEIYSEKFHNTCRVMSSQKSRDHRI